MPDKKRPLKVFLCHAKDDKAKVQKFYDYLQKHGVSVWFSAVDLLPGQDIRLEIPKAVNTSDAIIVCLTKNSVDKEGYIQTEIRLALEKSYQMPEGRIFLIPARLEDCEIPYSMNRYQYVDLFEPSGYSRLMKALQLRASQLQLSNTEITTAANSSEVQQENNGHVREENIEIEIPQIIEGNKPDANIAGRLKPAKRNSKWDTAIVVALIGLVGTIGAALFSSPLIEKWFTSTATATFTITPQPTVTLAATETFTPTVASVPIAITDSKGVSMVLIPDGDFTMGSDKGDPDEQPIHSIYLENFYIDKFEITNGLYQACVMDGVCQVPSSTSSSTHLNYYSDPKYGDYPVIYVDWNMAKSYCEWRDSRLPTEAEWEKAARGTDARTYPWGEGIGCNFANFGGLNCVGDTTAVGSYKDGISFYGVYDMAGNVWEWVSSRYQTYPYNPNDGRESLTVWDRVFRGGSWRNPAKEIRSSFRSYERQTYITNFIGFRCAKDVP